MTIKRNYEEIERRCQILENLGFEIEHEDRRVKVMSQDYPLPDICVDFSAIDERRFAEHAVKEVYRQAIEIGRNSLQQDLKALLGIYDE